MAKIKDSFNRVAALQGMMIIIVALAMVEATSLMQYFYAREKISQGAKERALGLLDRAELRIDNIVDQVETAVRNNMWSARAQVPRPDSLWSLTAGIVRDNPVIYGSALALVENYNRQAGRFFAPYAYRDSDEIKQVQLGTEEYNYQEKEWFVKPLELKRGYWSEPYNDEGGGNQMMTTYSIPVQDRRGRTAGVLTADVSLEWVTALLGEVDVYPSSFNVLASRTGRIMACPVKEFTMKKTVQEVAASSSPADSAGFHAVTKAMLTGETGSVKVTYKGKAHQVFFNPVERTGWYMCVVVPEDEILGEVRKTGRQVSFLQLLGLLMLILVLWATLRNQKRLKEISENKNRIESELHVARGIQMSMLPKIFPPFPERDDIDLFATIIPAKEVGGDLYDFFIREDKLFFCIGDVSGKGVPASLVMATTRSLFRTVAAHENSPQRIVTAMNDSMSENNESEMFVTLFCGVLDLNTGHLRYCNAGHNAPYVLGVSGTNKLPVRANLALGVLKGMPFTEQEADFSCGSGLFLYTDGLNEAENKAHGQFGEKGIEAVLDRGLSSALQVEAMTDAVKAFAGDAPQSDDLTILYIKYMNDKEAEMTERHLILHNDIQQIPQLASFVESVAEIARLDVSLTMSLNLALEEAVSNVIMYAYPPGADGLVDVEAIIRKGMLEFIITDNGIAFDPTAAPEADISLSAEERPIGGLGIFLVRNIMDTVHYQRKDGKNILTMTKKTA